MSALRARVGELFAQALDTVGDEADSVVVRLEVTSDVADLAADERTVLFALIVQRRVLMADVRDERPGLPDDREGAS
jgi:hypothetical protein